VGSRTAQAPLHTTRHDESDSEQRQREERTSLVDVRRERERECRFRRAPGAGVGSHAHPERVSSRPEVRVDRLVAGADVVVSRSGCAAKRTDTGTQPKARGRARGAGGASVPRVYDGGMKRAAAAAALGLVASLVHWTASAQQPLYRSGVEVVDVAVVVSDEEGWPVGGLSASDFLLTERGIPQKIALFDHVRIPVWRGDAPPRELAVAADVSSNERPADGRLFVLVLDALHVSPANLTTVRREARQFIEQHVGPSDLVAVLSPGAIAEASQDFTADKARLVAAVEHFSATALRSATLEIEQERLAAVALDMPMLHGGRDPSDGERADRARSLSSVLEALAGHLARVERRRKALLLFSEGVDYNTADLNGTVQRDATDVGRAMDRALGALMRSNVSLYAVDPRGLSGADTAGERLPYRPAPTAPRADGSLPPMDFSEPTLEGEYARSLASLRLVSEPTGGFVLDRSNDPAEAFDRIVRECSDYYVLGYTPAASGQPGEYRPVEVRVNRPGVRVIARRGYVAPAPAAPSARPAAAVEPTSEAPRRLGFAGGRAQAPQPLAADAPVEASPKGLHEELAWLLSSPLPVEGLPIRVQAAAFKGGEKKQVVQLITEVQGGGLAFHERGGRFESRIELASFTVDSRGRGANGRATTIDLRLKRDEYDRVRATGIRWLSQLELEPGRYQLRVAGRAPGSGRAGLVTADVDVPAFAGRARLSGLTIASAASAAMVTRGQARLADTLGLSPTAERVFVSGDRIVAAAELYCTDPTPPAVVMAVERGDGEVAMTRTERARPGGASGVAAVSLVIDTATLSPGRYVLRFQVDQAESSATIRRVPFHVIPAGTGSRP
jgi:VWFA-related protein